MGLGFWTFFLYLFFVGWCDFVLVGLVFFVLFCLFVFGLFVFFDDRCDFFFFFFFFLYLRF